MSYVAAFREFDREVLRKPAPYFPVRTECKGIANLVIGTLQLLTSQLMKCSNNTYYSLQLSNKHLEIGKASLSQGLKETVPSALFVATFSAAVSFIDGEK